MSQKVIMDSIHGYITLSPTFSFIIDTPEFQRLKSIEQGSFRVLYPAARHDRFIHSLGTFHLAQKFATNFIRNIKDDLGICVSQDFLKLVTDTFLYAALLHDIGHAPFSHTTEKFFKRENKGDDFAINKGLFSALRKVTNNAGFLAFEKDFPKASHTPHEIMSATILIQDAQYFLQDNLLNVDLELAARMVIGCTYQYENLTLSSQDEKNEYGIKNCFIRLLNSETVDVDKLDYITRDARMSGFLNVPIDIDRLVSSITAIKEDGFIHPSFRKSALSVIDNVFRARAEESLWMLSHPIVLYDSELLSYCINLLHTLVHQDYIENVFSIEALSKSGVTVNGKRYRLLSDIDISADLRSFYESNDLIKELYDRHSRRHPIWKSCYEYKYLFDENEEEVFLYFKSLMDYMKDSEIFVLNQETYDRIQSDINASQNVKVSASFLKRFFDEEGLAFDLVILPYTNSFSAKFDPNAIYISFTNLPKRNNQNYVTYEFLKGSNKTESKRLFYIYSKEKFKTANLESFINQLSKATKKSRAILHDL